MGSYPANKGWKVQRARPEETAHRAIAGYLNLVAPRNKSGVAFIWAHVPNQRGTRKKWEMGLMKALGALPGFADIIIIGPGSRAYFGEIKPPKGTTSPDQELFEEALFDVCGEHAQYDIWRSIDDAEASLRKWNLI